MDLKIKNPNGIVIIDKPEGMTSHDVVSRLRRIFGTRRVGHSGTLDPLATGVLPVFVGRATRACEFALCDEKSYIAELRLGLSTETQDITGAVVEEKAVSVTPDEFYGVCQKFCGEIMQTPPMYSAIKVNGVPLYKLAREGKEIEREARCVMIEKIKPSHIGGNDYRLEVSCSKGTYIRTLVHDIGKALSCGACMTALRRTRAGIFTIDKAKTIEELEGNPTLLPCDYMFGEYEAVTIDSSGEKKCRNGADVPFNAKNGAKYRVYSENGEFLMLAMGNEKGALVTIKSFFEV